MEEGMGTYQVYKVSSPYIVSTVGIITRDSVLNSSCPILLSVSCKSEAAEEHQPILETMPVALCHAMDAIHIHIISLVVDGKSCHTKVLIELCYHYVQSTVHNQIAHGMSLNYAFRKYPE